MKKEIIFLENYVIACWAKLANGRDIDDNIFIES